MITCVVCERPLLRVNTAHLRYHHRKGHLLAGTADPTNKQLGEAYRKLAGIDGEVAINPYVAPLSPEELELYRQDPQRERKLRIAKRVYCRECGIPAYRLAGGRGHLDTRHRWHARQYREKWPGAPLNCLDYREKAADKQMQFRIEEPEESRRRQHACYTRDPEPAKVAAINWNNGHLEQRREIVRRNTEKRRAAGKTKLNQRKQALARAPKVSAEELNRLLANPALMEPNCVCLEPDCRGRIIKTHIDRHLRWLHQKTWEEYRVQHPGALRAPVAVKGVTGLWARLKRLQGRSGRPRIANDPRPMIIGELKINRRWSWRRIQRTLNKKAKKPITAKGYENCWIRAGRPVPPPKKIRT